MQSARDVAIAMPASTELNDLPDEMLESIMAECDPQRVGRMCRVSDRVKITICLAYAFRHLNA